MCESDNYKTYEILLKKSSLSPVEQEALFQDALKKWEETGDKVFWDRMFMRVWECCRAMAIRLAPGKPLIDNRAMDAAIIIMDRIKRNKSRPMKLSAFCYWPVQAAIHGPKAIKEDRELQYHEEYEEQTQDENTYETVRGICRMELMNTLD